MPEDREEKPLTGLQRYNIERQLRRRAQETGKDFDTQTLDSTLNVGETERAHHLKKGEYGNDYGGYDMGGQYDDKGKEIKTLEQWQAGGSPGAPPPSSPPVSASSAPTPEPPADDLGLYQIEYGRVGHSLDEEGRKSYRLQYAGKQPMVTFSRGEKKYELESSGRRYTPAEYEESFKLDMTGAGKPKYKEVMSYEEGIASAPQKIYVEKEPTAIQQMGQTAVEGGQVAGAVAGYYGKQAGEAIGTTGRVAADIAGVPGLYTKMKESKQGPRSGYHEWKEKQAEKELGLIMSDKQGNLVRNPKTGEFERARPSRETLRNLKREERYEQTQMRLQERMQSTLIRKKIAEARRMEQVIRQGEGYGPQAAPVNPGLLGSPDGASSTVGLLAASERGMVGGKSTPQLMGPSGGGLLGPQAWGGGLLSPGAAGSGLLGPSYGGNTGLLASNIPGGGMPGGGLLGGSMMGGGLFGGGAPQVQGQPGQVRYVAPGERPGIRHRRVFATVVLPGGSLARIPIPEARVDSAGYNQIVTAAYKQSGQLDAAALASAANLPTQGAGYYSQGPAPQDTFQPQGGLVGFGVSRDLAGSHMPGGYSGPLISNPMGGGLLGGSKTIGTGGFA